MSSLFETFMLQHSVADQKPLVPNRTPSFFSSARGVWVQSGDEVLEPKAKCGDFPIGHAPLAIPPADIPIVNGSKTCKDNINLQ